MLVFRMILTEEKSSEGTPSRPWKLIGNLHTCILPNSRQKIVHNRNHSQTQSNCLSNRYCSMQLQDSPSCQQPITRIQWDNCSQGSSLSEARQRSIEIVQVESVESLSSTQTDAADCSRNGSISGSSSASDSSSVGAATSSVDGTELTKIADSSTVIDVESRAEDQDSDGCEANEITLVNVTDNPVLAFEYREESLTKEGRKKLIERNAVPKLVCFVRSCNPDVKLNALRALFNLSVSFCTFSFSSSCNWCLLFRWWMR